MDLAGPVASPPSGVRGHRPARTPATRALVGAGQAASDTPGTHVDTIESRSVPDEAREPFEYHGNHLARAVAEGDGPAMLTHARSLCEVVIKTVLSALGHPVPGKFPAQLGAAHRALSRHPGDLEHDTELRDVAGSLMNLARHVGEDRNDSGSAHGHTTLATFDPEIVTVGANAARLWCRWALSILPTAQASHPETLMRDLGHEVNNRNFHSGELTERLAQVGLDTLDEQGARALGATVARRAARGTFNVDWEGVRAAIDSPEAFPPAYRVGALQGLVMTRDGRIRIVPAHADVVADVAETLGADGVSAVRELTTSLPNAPVSNAVANEELEGFVARLAERAAAIDDPDLHEALDALTGVLAEHLAE